LKNPLFILIALAILFGINASGMTVWAAAPVAAGISAPIAAPAASAVTGPAETRTLSATSSAAGLPPAITEGGTSVLLPGEAAPPAESGVTESAAMSGDAPKTAVSGDIQEMSSLEKSAAADEIAEAIKPQPFKIGKLEQFGYSFFRKPGSFAPLLDVPVGPDYVVGPGDTLVVTSSGSLEGTWSLEVNRNGEIILPKVGAVPVLGVPFARVSEVIRANLSKAFVNVQVQVTLGKLRLIKVYIVGEVSRPGDYDVTSLSTVINALIAAGGPTKNGSLRSIQVKRGGEVVETVDLYEFLLKGDKTHDIRLQSGDVLYVPLIGHTAGIGGDVKRPAIYELSTEKTLKDLLELAGGFNPSGYLHRLQISRLEAHDKKLVADFSIDPKISGKELEELTAGIAIQNQDIVKIFPIDITVRNHVRLEGYVLRPGPYALKPGMRVRDLIGPDNLLPEYYPDNLEITRLVLPDFHPEVLYVNLEKAMQGEESDNILLNEFDVVQVFSRWEMEEMPKVRIGGEVNKPGAYRVMENMKLRDLVLISGNVKKTAFLGNAEITRTEITKTGVTSHIINVDLEKALKGNPEDNILLADMDEVVIRRVPDWKEETNRYVTLNGEFRFPGTYPILKGEKLSSIIRRAGGYTDKAYLKGAKFTRAIVAEIQQKRMDEIIARTENDIAQKQSELASVASSKEELEATKSALEGLSKSLERLKSVKAEGRVSLVLAPLEDLKKTSSDLELMGGDTLTVTQSPNAVMVLGEVYNPTTVIYSPGMQVSHYLKKAGGPTSEAEEDEMYVIRIDGTVESRNSTSFGMHWDNDGKSWSFGGFNSITLDAGDTLVVPQRLEKIAWMREIKDIAYIIGQIALTAGVVIAAGL